MSKFNPLSTAVAVATASLMVVVAGCAMNHDGTTVAGDSRDSDRNAERLAQTTPMDPTVTANESLRGDQSNPPADSSQMAQSGTSTEPTPPVAQADTSAAPYPSTQTAQAQPSSTYPSTTSSYPSSSTSSSTDTSSSSMNGTPSTTTPSTTASTTPSTDTSSSSSTTSGSSYQSSLPPRSDRN